MPLDEIDRDDLLRRVSQGDHSQCQHDLLGTCPVLLALAINRNRLESAPDVESEDETVN